MHEMFFEDMSYTEMTEKLSDSKRKLGQFRDRIQTYEQNLERLDTDYKNSKALESVQRFATLKVLIKDVISTSPSLLSVDD